MLVTLHNKFVLMLLLLPGLSYVLIFQSNAAKHKVETNSAPTEHKFRWRFVENPFKTVVCIHYMLDLRVNARKHGLYLDVFR